MSIWDTPTDQEALDEVNLADEVAFVGQEHIKSQLAPFLDNEDMPHMLLTGQPGLGKTQFGRWVAWKRQDPFFERLAPVRADYLPPYGVILLDEVHRQADVESLFPIMDQGLIKVIAATTKPDKLDSAFRSRFLLSFVLKPYKQEEMEKIIAVMYGEPVPVAVANVLAKAARGNPRVAERIIRTAKGLQTLDVGQILKTVRITADGLSDPHFEYLGILSEAKRPLGIETIKAQTYFGASEVVPAEQALIEMGYVELRPEGRRLTPKGEAYIKVLKNEGML